MKPYSQHFKSLNKRVKTFYLGAIGQLILCTDIEDARKIITSIFTIALSETDGNLKNGISTRCDQERVKLMNLMTAGNIRLETLETDSNNNNAIYIIEETDSQIDSIINMSENSWTAWASRFYVMLNPPLAQI